MVARAEAIERSKIRQKDRRTATYQILAFRQCRTGGVMALPSRNESGVILTMPITLGIAKSMWK